MELASPRPNSKQEKLPIIQALWIGDSLGELERLSVASFLANGHPYHLYAYSDIKDVPAGAQLMDANQILPQREVYRARRRGYAPFADWFRYELLHQKGGYWMDMDMVCLKKLDLPDAVIFVKEDADRFCNAIFCNAIMRFPQGHPFLEALCARCRHPIRTAWRDAFVVPLGMRRLRKILLHGRFWFFLAGKKRARIDLHMHLTFIILGDFLSSDARWHKLRNNGMANGGGRYFYPVSGDKWFTLLDDTYKDTAEVFPDSYTVHFWNEMYSTRAEDRQSILDSASPHSVYARLKRRHLS